MKVAVFSLKPFEKEFLLRANELYKFEFVFFETNLNSKTASLAKGFKVISAFVTDVLNEEVLSILAVGGTKIIALRSAGFNNVDIDAASKLGIKVVRVPAYSPFAVAEHTIALILALNRKIHKAYARVREGNFSLDGLLGFDIHGKKVGIIGTGKIGSIVAKILKGLNCNLLGYDTDKNDFCIELGLKYVPLEELFSNSDIITIHCPLVDDTFHLINESAIKIMKKGVMLINTSRGAVIDTKAVIKGLKSGSIGSLGLDVYEEEEGIFFKDLSSVVIQDDIFTRLVTFPNVLITAHQAFFTKEALENISKTTLANIDNYLTGGVLLNEISNENLKIEKKLLI